MSSPFATNSVFSAIFSRVQDESTQRLQADKATSHPIFDIESHRHTSKDVLQTVHANSEATIRGEEPRSHPLIERVLQSNHPTPWDDPNFKADVLRWLVTIPDSPLNNTDDYISFRQLQKFIVSLTADVRRALTADLELLNQTRQEFENEIADLLRRHSALTDRRDALVKEQEKRLAEDDLEGLTAIDCQLNVIQTETSSTTLELAQAVARSCVLVHTRVPIVRESVGDRVFGAILRAVAAKLPHLNEGMETNDERLGYSKMLDELKQTIDAKDARISELEAMRSSKEDRLKRDSEDVETKLAGARDSMQRAQEHHKKCGAEVERLVEALSRAREALVEAETSELAAQELVTTSEAELDGLRSSATAEIKSIDEELNRISAERGVATERAEDMEAVVNEITEGSEVFRIVSDELNKWTSQDAWTENYARECDAVDMFRADIDSLKAENQLLNQEVQRKTIKIAADVSSSQTEIDSDEESTTAEQGFRAGRILSDLLQALLTRLANLEKEHAEAISAELLTQEQLKSLETEQLPLALQAKQTAMAQKQYRLAVIKSREAKAIEERVAHLRSITETNVARSREINQAREKCNTAVSKLNALQSKYLMGAISLDRALAAAAQRHAGVSVSLYSDLHRSLPSHFSLCLPTYSSDLTLEQSLPDEVYEILGLRVAESSERSNSTESDAQLDGSLEAEVEEEGRVA